MPLEEIFTEILFSSLFFLSFSFFKQHSPDEKTESIMIKECWVEMDEKKTERKEKYSRRNELLKANYFIANI